MARNNRNPFIRGITNLRNITNATNKQTYGISRDIPKVISDNVFNKVDEISATILEKDRAIINNHMSRARLSNRTKNDNIKNLYEIINDQDMLSSMQTLIGGQNYKFSQTLKDYEIIKRCIPQVHKVITNLKNSIISPDAMADSAIGIEYPVNIKESERSKIDKIIEDYKLNGLLDDIVEEYLISSVKYLTVVPYTVIPDMLSRSLDECIAELQTELGEPKTLLESSGMNVDRSEVLTESIKVEYYADKDAVIKNIKSTLEITGTSYENALRESINNIEFIDGGMNYFKTALLNEAIAEARVSKEDKDNSMKKILKNLQSKSTKVVTDISAAAEGLVDDKTVADIRKNVDFKGCHIEELDPSRTIPFKLRGTLIGYFYVEEKTSPLDNQTTNISSIMDKINASVYMKQAGSDNGQRVENMVIKSISERLVKSIDAKFLNDNYDDMNIIYEFVRINEIHKKNCRVTFFHPDDICEFRRKDGSIMKNAMFIAKLYLLTLLTNVLANVTRGGDRQIHYVKTGLTTDVEGSVNSTIRAIKQNQIRYSDIGTINDIFNIVGSLVDVFMPVSIDGERPIETETISGQNIDMNNDFLNSLLKSIIQSFGMPSSVIDDFENIEFARTIPMSNLESAKLVLNAQNEINEPLTKLLRLIISYEMPDFEQVNEVYAKLTPPSVIVLEMNKERMQSITEIANMLAEILLPQNDQESNSEKLLRKFKEEYTRRNLPTLDWDEIDDMLKKIGINKVIDDKKDNINKTDNDQGF